MKIKQLLGRIGKGWIIMCVVALAVFWTGSGFISTFNEHRTYVADFHNWERANQADFDNMWKTIQQKYQIKGDYERTFIQGLKEMAAGRGGGALSKTIQEATGTSPDSSIYKEIMATIEGKRNQFESHQKQLSDIKNLDDKLLSRFPTNIYLCMAQPLELHMVTSARTDQAFQAGQDNDVKLKE